MGIGTILCRECMKKFYTQLFLFIFISGYPAVSLGVTMVHKRTAGLNRLSPRKNFNTFFTKMSHWITTCKSLPQNRKGASSKKDSSFKMIDGTLNAGQTEMYCIVNAWLKMMAEGSLSNDHVWQLGMKPSVDFFEVNASFKPFAQKMVAAPGTQFYVHGDLHGDVHSLVVWLESLQCQGVLDDAFCIIPDNVYFLFLGDYVDRGAYGCEVIYTLLRLSLANPDRVILVRGNHEDENINAHSGSTGFKNEVFAKFQKESLYHFIINIYTYMPVVFYLGAQDKADVVNYLQCCHGGLEIGYNPSNFLDTRATKYQLLGSLNQQQFVASFCNECLDLSKEIKDPKKKAQLINMASWWNSFKQFLLNGMSLLSPFDVGFLWNDFDVADSKPIYYNRGRGWIYGYVATSQILSWQSSTISNIRGVIRAHQHGDLAMMKKLIESRGVYKMWRPVESITGSIDRYFRDGLVWTFNVGPDTVYGAHHNFGWDAYAKITVQKEYSDWTMQVFNQEVVT